jgi:hypothetical protein
MFAIVKNNQVVQYVQPNSVFHVNWVEYGADWIVTATQEQKDAIGLVDVVHGPRKDERFYWVTQQEPVYNADAKQVEINFTATPKNLAEIQKLLTDQTNQTAYTLLLPSDWMVVKAMETSTTVPADWSTWRQAVRTKTVERCAAITAATDIDTLAALGSVDWPSAPNAVQLV